jgi:hypothetical protein
VDADSGSAGRREAVQVVVPNLIGMTVPAARKAGHDAGLVVASADPDGPPLRALTWPGVWVVTAQRPAPATRAGRRDFLIIEFKEVPGGAAGDQAG